MYNLKFEILRFNETFGISREGNYKEALKCCSLFVNYYNHCTRNLIKTSVSAITTGN